MFRLTEFERLNRSLKHIDILQTNAFISLEMLGPRLIAVLTENRSLRQLAKTSGLSPTYLSMVAQQKQVISAGAYTLLMRVFNNGDKQSDNTG